LKFDFSYCKNALIQRNLFYSILLVFVIAFITLIIGSQIPLSSDQANIITNELNQTLTEHLENNTMVPYIFMNNFTICLIMFIPVIGAGLGLFILFDTGVALNAIASTRGYSVWFGLLNTVSTPVFWIEFAAYSIAMAESIWLFRRLTQKRWGELKRTGIFIAVCAGLLTVGAVVEVWLITSFG
jgi:hypothetical protein